MPKARRKVDFSTKNNVLINNLYPGYRLPLTHGNVKELVSKVMDGEDCRIGEFVLNFVDDKAIRRINKQYLEHDFFTDIITFPYSDKRKNIEGELFISLDTVKKNGKFYLSGYKGELKRVIIHGCLHLAGYLDATKKQKELIRSKENFYLG